MVVLKAAKILESELLGQIGVLLLKNQKDCGHLLTFIDWVVNNSYDRVENAPHNFRIVNFTLVIFDIQISKHFHQEALIHLDSFVPQGRRQLPHKIKHSNRFHIGLTLGIEHRPCTLEPLYVVSGDGLWALGAFRSLNGHKTVIDDRNEDIHEDEEHDYLEGDPEDKSIYTCFLVALVHDSIPGLSSCCPEQSHESHIERFEVRILVYEIPVLDLIKQAHSSYSKREQDESE